MKNYSFIYYRFGNNQLEESTLNKVQSFKFLNGEEIEIALIAATKLQIKQDEVGGNQHIIIICNPIGEQTNAIGIIQETDKSQEYRIEGFSLPQRYKDINKSWDNDYFEFSNSNINEFTEVLNENSEFEKKYVEFSDNANKSIENLTLKIAAPVITVAPTWTQNHNE